MTEMANPQSGNDDTFPLGDRPGESIPRGMEIPKPPSDVPIVAEPAPPMIDGAADATSKPVTSPSPQELASRTIPPTDDSSDTRSLPSDSSSPVPTSTRFRVGEWEHEFSAHKIAVELRRIEVEVRQLIEDRDPKRKRKFSGTRRWNELEEDLIALRFSGRLPEETIQNALQLVAKRHFLFRQLRFVASTRATWNT